jgi:RNA polymerase sigma factor (sigma-70 family)
MNHKKEMKNYIGAIIKYSNQMYLESPVCDKEDLVQAGFIGMMNGLSSFSEEKSKKTGAKKTTYVIQCIKNAMMQEANKFYGPISIPHGKRLRLNAFKKLFSSGLEKEEIISKLDISEEEYEEFKTLSLIKSSIPLASLLEEEEPSKEDSQDNIDIKTSYLQDINSLNLNKEEKDILTFKISGMSYNDIANFYNVSRETMRQKVHKIFVKIKKSINKNV